ncbi:MAG: DNA alkylation repair protein [Magnetococcales bacterium]|nr:DNA alkylation repair protein [Magnetococcales bacterium]
MSKSLKEIYHRPLVEELAARVAANHPGFDVETFVAEVVADFPSLELMARSRRIAEGLRAYLPATFPDAVAILLASMGEDDGSGGVEGYDGFRHLPFLNFVGRYGLNHPDLALDALERMTRHFSAEFDIRPYILNHPKLTLPRLHTWARHEDWRLRRLASEGSRPRLPWGLRLKPFIDDPTPCLEILEPLHADHHPVVRRSVANHLNDVSRDHPDLAVATAQRWLNHGDAGTLWIVNHGLRTLVKQGHAGALALLGFSGSLTPEVVAFTLMPPRVMLGETATFTTTLRCREAATLSIDYIVHHQRQNGSLSPKVFKLARRRVLADEVIHLEKSHPLRPITTRRYYPGLHRLDLLVNGRVVCGGTFELAMPPPQ